VLPSPFAPHICRQWKRDEGAWHLRVMPRRYVNCGWRHAKPETTDESQQRLMPIMNVRERHWREEHVRQHAHAGSHAV